MVEPRTVPKSEWADPAVPEYYIAEYFRQPATKTNQVRTLILPEAVAQQLRERRDASRFTEPHHPLLASGKGQPLWAANIRTRLRKAVADEPTLVGTTPHTLRRTVASLVAYEFGLDPARMQLGHSLLGRPRSLGTSPTERRCPTTPAHSRRSSPTLSDHVFHRETLRARPHLVFVEGGPRRRPRL